MKLHIHSLDAVGQAGLMVRMTADPIMILREHTINGIEAIERNTAALEAQGISVEDTLLVPTCEIDIGRDKTHPQKVVIVNVGGDFITPTIAAKHLCALGKTGNTNVSFFKGQRKDNNIGAGAKIATLSSFPTIFYRSKEAGVSGGMRYQLTLLDGKLEATYEACPQEEFSVLAVKDSGTEVLIWGADEEEDTWDALNRIYTSSRSRAIRAKAGQTGNALKKWLSNRFYGRFIDAWGREIPIRVREYSSETKDQTSRPSIWYVGEEVENPAWLGTDSTTFDWDTNTAATLQSVVIVTDTSNKKKSNFRTTGGVSLVYKNEVYSERMISDWKASDAILTQCGLGMLPGDIKNKVWLVVSLPDTALIIPSLDRTKLIAPTGSPIEFEEVAEKIAQSLGKMKNFSRWIKKNVTANDKSLDDQLQEAFKSQLAAFEDLLKGGSGGAKNKPKRKNNKTNKGGPGGTPNSPGLLGSGVNLGAFEHEVVPNKNAPLIELQIRSGTGKTTYCLTLNPEHAQFKGILAHMKKVLEVDVEVPAGAFNSSRVREVLTNAIAVKYFVASFAIVLERKVFVKESSKELLKVMTPEMLQTAIDISDRKLISKSVKDFILNHYALKNLKAA